MFCTRVRFLTLYMLLKKAGSISSGPDVVIKQEFIRP